jgi:hypothetical protein
MMFNQDKTKQKQTKTHDKTGGEDYGQRLDLLRILLLGFLLGPCA